MAESLAAVNAAETLSPCRSHLPLTEASKTTRLILPPVSVSSTSQARAWPSPTVRPTVVSGLQLPPRQTAPTSQVPCAHAQPDFPGAHALPGLHPTATNSSEPRKSRGIIGETPLLREWVDRPRKGRRLRRRRKPALRCRGRVTAWVAGTRPHI